MDDKTILDGGMLPIGTMLKGKYRIDSYLASGGFGNTYVATDLQSHIKIAVKEFFMKGVSLRNVDHTTVTESTPDNKATFESQKNKFRKEAMRIMGLHNRHIVGVHDYFDANGTSYYVMDYIDGKNLSSLLKRTGKPVSESDALSILNQMLDALNTVHEATPPILHLDIKPANIMVDKQDNAVLIDFGASKQMDADGGATTSSAVSYTNGYAPFEQMEKSLDKFGPWTDFYALGATLYYLLTNSKPPMPSVILDDHTTDKHESLPFPASVSYNTRRLVTWMMRPNRGDRPQSVSQLKAYLYGDETVISEDSTILNTNNDQTVLLEQQNKGNGNGTKILIGVLAVIALIVIIAIAVSYNGNSNNIPVSDNTPATATVATVDSAKPATAEDSIKAKRPEENRLNWNGEYYAESDMGNTAGGTGIIYAIHIKVEKTDEAGNYKGTMTIDGWQTGVKVSVTGNASGKTLKLWYDKDLYDEEYKPFTSGDALLALRYDNNTLSAEWFVPMQDYTNGEITIEKLTPQRKNELGIE